MFLVALSRLLVATTYVMILWGGMVHTRGASLACPDWPLCYGMVMPPMEGAIALEHGHRMLGTFIGAMTLVLLAGALWADAKARAGHGATAPSTRLAGWAALGVGLVIFQGVLGGLTVLYRLPPPVSIAHFGTSLLFLAWATLLAVRVRRAFPGRAAQRAARLPEQAPELARVNQAATPLAGSRGVLLAAAAVYLQGLLGSAVRHTHASMSCGPEAFACAGRWLPESGPQWLQTSHRLFALLAMALVVAATIPVFRAARQSGRAGLRGLAIASHAVLLLQLLMGVLTLQTGIHLHVVMTHLALGVLLWAILVALWASLQPTASMQAPAHPLADAAPVLPSTAAAAP